MEKRADESFKQYASRFMDETTQIYPLLMEKEMIVRFISTLQAPYYEKVAKSFPKSLADVVMLCRMIDEAMKNELGQKNLQKQRERKNKG